MTNDNGVIPFKPRVVTPEVTPATPDAAIVALLEAYLERAKSGKIKFAAIATVDDMGVAISTWEPEQSSPQLITQALGAVAYLNYRFAASVDEGAVIDDFSAPVA